MNPYEYFDEEYYNIQLTINSFNNLINQSRSFYDAVNIFQYHLVNSKDIAGKEKLNLTFDSLEDIISNLKEILLKFEEAQSSLRKMKNV